MILEEFKKLLATVTENENIELKEAKDSFSILGDNGRKRKSVYGYAVAIGNEGGGLLILGVEDKTKRITGTNALENIEEVKSKIFQRLGKRINIEEVYDGLKRVVVITVPPRNQGDLLKFYGVPLVRIGEELREMDDQTQRNILLELEQNRDFSAEFIEGFTENDLDIQALQKMETLYNSRHETALFGDCLLEDLHLKEGKKYCYAALILLGTEDSFRRFLDNAEIIFQFRYNTESVEYTDRVDYKKAFLLLENELWDKINSRNEITQIQEGFLTREIQSFNKRVIKESVLNAITHRDYRNSGSIVIQQSPQEFCIESPGGFLQGITPENILRKTQSRNRRIAETLQHLGFVQRAGQGMDTIFRETIQEGKNIPDLSASDEFNVVLRLSAQVQNVAFLKYLENIAHERQLLFSSEDLILLQNIEKGNSSYTKESLQKFLNFGVIEQMGKTRGMKFVLSQHYYVSQGKSGLHTRLTGIGRDAKKHLIVEHLKRNKQGATVSDFTHAFPDITRQDISNLLQELKRARIIRKNGGSTRGAVWGLKLNNE